MSDSQAVAGGESPAELLLRAAAMVPAERYALAAVAVVSVFLYRFLELHVIGDALRGFRGGRVELTFHPASEIYHRVASKCRSLHGRYLATPWLASPHLQTLFLGISGRPPSFTYKRQLYTVHDGGTIALDWLLASDLEDGFISKDDSTPLVVVVPGLTSDSAAAYVKHSVYSIASKGWNVVVSNHRGLGGVSITSDCFYNGGWTEDVREVIKYLHQRYPQTPLFCIGTSIGANIVVKYLGEEGENTPVAGAASICSPWDLLIGDRFISRKLVQRIYDKALAIGLKSYAKLHQPVLARLANWEGIRKSRSIREFDHHATCVVARYETVDTYYRQCSSASYVGNVSVPLLCINALDDPLCTREAIPWDECRANKNIVLATTPNGGHLAFFQGLTAGRLWWVGAASEFLFALHESSYMHRQKANDHVLHSSLESSIDKSPYVNIMEDGMVAPVTKDGPGNNDGSPSDHEVGVQLSNGVGGRQQLEVSGEKHNEQVSGAGNESPAGSANRQGDDIYSNKLHEIIAPVKRSINQLTRHQGRSIWLLAYIAFVTSWPLLGSLAFITFRKKFRNPLQAK
ncbi:embryogenesis-associated protein EMB8-like isoform X2 [Panicum virgatum]|uniref:embryogenesis-associated protein EMB8-like isoform X2 n=1 Tax=Panicum virgatum TaxID=38727 RepID=UPI0019D6943F|nr:embryogenesis-associated protein EMB8-like isoform X2 [Panicum virgatum]